MAVENKYINTTDLNTDGTPKRPRNARAVRQFGAHEYMAKFTFEVAAADDNDSIYRVFEKVPPNIIPTAFLILSDGLTSSSDWNIGVAKPIDRGGAVISENCLADALDLSTAGTLIAPKNGLNQVAIEDVGLKRLWEIAGLTLAATIRPMDIILKGVAVGSAAGTIAGMLRYTMD